MNFEIYIRPLIINDAKTSYKWRNNPEVWTYTGGRPDKFITEGIELEWIAKAIQRTGEYRFAICLKDNDQYIGNIQLTDITSSDAQYHIFIGETEFWGKGIAKRATNLILDYAFNHLDLNRVYLEVNPLHQAAIIVYEKSGFVKYEGTTVNDFLKMAIRKEAYETINCLT